MQRFAARAFGLSLLILAGSSACRGRPATAPYAEGQAPDHARLVQLTRPPLQAIQVPKAKIRSGRSPAGTLMLAAQASPPRFAGSISAAGNEMVSIAVNENTYSLRWLYKNGLAQGFYSGPPSPCAIQRVLGVALSSEDLTRLLLAGSPLIENPEVFDQRWEGERVRKRQGGHPGHEVVSLRNDRLEQELRFAWVDGDWRFAGTSMWRLDGTGRTWMWTIRHEGLRAKGAAYLPAKTHISSPGAKGDVELTITYEEQRPDPAALLGAPTGDGDGDGDSDTWDDNWDDDEEGWEDGEEGDGEDGGETAPPDPEPEPKAAPIPEVFQLDASGLKKRGDLCRPK